MIEISIVVPLYNEDGVVDELHRRLTQVLVETKRTYEIVFVDDGSSDNTLVKAEAIAAKDEHVKLVTLRANFGQTAGLAAGIDHASGSIIIPMDGDLQHAPEDIPQFIAKIDEGYDVVSGWRKKRVDGLIARRIPSMIANRLMKYISGIQLHDFGTTFKAYRRDVIEHINLYGQFHRFIPVLCRGLMKVKICEIPIQNIVRPVGKSNYGIWRTFTVFFDLIRLKFLMNFYVRPLQLFGSMGICLMLPGFGILAYIAVARIFFDITLVALGSSLFLLSMGLIFGGLNFIFFGLIAELMVKIYRDGHRVRCYVVKNVKGTLPDPIYPWNGSIVAAAGQPESIWVRTQPQQTRTLVN
jgi:glycosyltransferase involved in cell wall biosynthesis